jgi:hypothetical protein
MKRKLRWLCGHNFPKSRPQRWVHQKSKMTFSPLLEAEKTRDINHLFVTEAALDGNITVEQSNIGVCMRVGIERCDELGAQRPLFVRQGGSPFPQWCATNEASNLKRIYTVHEYAQNENCHPEECVFCPTIYIPLSARLCDNLQYL